METYCLRRKKNTANKSSTVRNVRKTKQRLVPVSTCVI